ncbi:MAG TPA: UDP-2,4-diacetamido-2,4,6-trideoxy-beta-L-altropyranose hydrolase, partial [Gemmataceae bacterium]|nr:UDP-2,4-diacetamido-2,4,6-trideoxy-beta-L-altropyranose hydrolase [Gemmataceae bacterium]
MTRPVLCIRADADPRMGTGHLMRCLALAQAWQDAGGETTFLTACRLDSLNSRLEQEGIQVLPLAAEPGSDADACETYETAHRLAAGWVVLDGYHFSAAFQAQVRRNGVRVLAVDDYGHTDHYAADLVLNQNLHAREELYHNREQYTRLLLGTRFALLRREFRKWRGWKREAPDVARKVLVTLGGSDPDNVTLHAIEALQALDWPGLEAVIVVGANNPHMEELESAVAGGESRIRLCANIADMADRMAWADVAIAAGGTTTWERALMALPSLVMILADNQREV